MQFIIPGPPIPLQRARAFKAGSKIKLFDSQKKEKQNFIFHLLEQINATPQSKKDHDDLFYVGSLAYILDLVFYMPIPASANKQRRQDLLSYPHRLKPDLSNLIKFVEDASNGILYRDDAQICQINAMKIYSSYPRTVVNINYHDTTIDKFSDADTFYDPEADRTVRSAPTVPTGILEEKTQTRCW